MSRIRIVRTKKGSFCVGEGNICQNNNQLIVCAGCNVYTGKGSGKLCFIAGEKFVNNRQQGKKVGKRT